jgi:hypothetical protein
MIALSLCLRGKRILNSKEIHHVTTHGKYYSLYYSKIIPDWHIHLFLT